jgi:hypothetical protein
LRISISGKLILSRLSYAITLLWLVTWEVYASEAPTLDELFNQRQSEVFVESSGHVLRLLAVDTIGSRHQRMILQLDSGLTILIVHNIDLAPRIENINLGDRINFRGEYIWNNKGGLVHWTHHDPDGSIVGGWLERGNKRYQ